MKRQTEPHGVVTHWVPTCLDVDPFNLPERYTLNHSGLINRILKACDQILIGSRSIVIQQNILGYPVSQKRINISQFQGLALRISPWQSSELTYAVSINLHHALENYCIPLFFAFDMDVTSARLQTWSRIFRLPILLPDQDGAWKEHAEQMGRLILRPAIPREPRTYLASRKPILSAFRETCRIDPDKRVSGKEISAWD